MEDKYIGRLLDGRYEILEVIGVGGMAVVYKAMCHRLNRPVAIKILKDEYSRDEEFRRRFHAESQAVAMMSHTNIVNVYDVSRSEGVDYIVMELIDGITLKQYMEKKGVLSWRETLHFSMQIAKALEHAHSRGIIHRDIKPHNIMILKDGSVKVADFGIARVASAQNTLTKEALGSVHYISPEQAKGGRVDNRTDLYSLGVVMYQMLTGRPPYDGDTPVSVAIQHINGTPLQPTLLNSNIPVGLEQITMHAMCADLNARYASASDMLRDMEEFRKNPSIRFTFGPEGETVRTVPTAPVRQPVQERQPVRQRRQDYEADDREEKGKRTLIIVVAICAVLAVFGIGYLIVSALSGGGSTEQTDVTDPVVPQLVGSIWDEVDLSQYPDLEFKPSYENNDEYPEGVVFYQSVEAGKTVKPGRIIDVTISLGEQTDTMPELKKKSKDYATSYLRALELNLKVLTEEEFSEDVDEGYVTRTDPAAGETLKDGQIVTVYVSKGSEEKKTKVPYVVGSSLDSAKRALENAKLTYSVSETYSTTVSAGQVISQSIPANTEVAENTEVALVVSKGKQSVTMPSVEGYDVGAATDVLRNLGLKVNTETAYSSTVPEGQVISQSHKQGTQLEPDTTVTLTVSLGPEPAPSVPETTEAPPVPDTP